MANLLPSPPYYSRSAAYDRLDRSEKGAASFFLGQVQAKMFAEALFGAATFVHLDVVLDALGRRRRRSRPDFVGYDHTGRVALSVEAKGRANGYTLKLRQSAKAQSQRLPGIVGLPTHAYAHIAYCEPDGTWCALLEDPPQKKASRDLAMLDVALCYYLPLVEAVVAASERDGADRVAEDWVVHLNEIGVSFTVPTIAVDALSSVTRDEMGRVHDIGAARERAAALAALVPLNPATPHPEREEADDQEPARPAPSEERPGAEEATFASGYDRVSVMLDARWEPLTKFYVQ